MKPKPETTWTTRDELDWVAFRYLSNELPDAEIAAFELRLADDQDAREAVARCVQLTHSVVALAEARACTPAEPRRGDRPARRSTIAAMLIAAAAVFFAFWIGKEFSQRERPDTVEPIAKTPSNPSASPTIGKPVGGAVDPSAMIDTWLQFDADVALHPDSSVDGSLAADESAKPSSGTAPVDDGSFNWVIAAVDDSPLAVPVPGRTSKEPKR